MAKLTLAGLKVAIRQQAREASPHSTNFDEISTACLSAIAGNGGLAGLLPEAVAQLAIDTTIAFCNLVADLETEMYEQRKQINF